MYSEHKLQKSKVTPSGLVQYVKRIIKRANPKGRVISWKEVREKGSVLLGPDDIIVPCSCSNMAKGRTISTATVETDKNGNTTAVVETWQTI